MARALVAGAARERRARGERLAKVRLVVDAEHYDTLLARELPGARVSVWIATANLKGLRVEAPVGTRARARGRYVSVLDVFAELVARGVEVRVVHGRPPSRPFREELALRPGLAERLGLRECPRSHAKVVAIDGRLLYLGSANFTGAGIGARGEGRRNFELGIVTEDEHLLDEVQARFDQLWSGRECAGCGLRRQCPRPIDTLTRSSPAASKAKRRAKPR